MTNTHPSRGILRVSFVIVAGVALADASRHGLEAQQSSDALTAIVGATLIDGNGGAPLPDATVVVKGNRIAAVGPRASVKVPAGTPIIDGAGRYVTPGFIDTNVHVSMYNANETLVRYQPRVIDVTVEAAQLHLKYGVTTIRDSYGQLLPLMHVRDAIARGETVGPRMLVAGNIVGWGGPDSRSFSGSAPKPPLSLFEEQMQDEITQGAGEELIDMTPDELRVAIDKYLDKGPDFIKYGGTTHPTSPSFIDFSPEAQKVIVEAAHKRGRVAETHSTNAEGLRLSILAGIDLIQHPEALGARELPDAVIQLIVERRIICAMLTNKFTGPVWKKHLKDQEKAAADRQHAERDKEAATEERRAKTRAEQRTERLATGIDLQMRRLNGNKLIRAGAVISIATDNTVGSAPEFLREPNPIQLRPGFGTIISIEGLVELGMTPGQALVAATKNGALACRMQKDLGTIETGKLADMLVLDADPLTDISNVRKLHHVIANGRVIDISKLPEKPVFYRPPQKTTTSQEPGASGR
jgi:imidazolonepropionase-like amidohydrolase